MGNSSLKKLGGVVDCECTDVVRNGGGLTVRHKDEYTFEVAPSQIYWAQQFVDPNTKERWLECWAVVPQKKKTIQLRFVVDLPQLPDGYDRCGSRRSSAVSKSKRTPRPTIVSSEGASGSNAKADSPKSKSDDRTSNDGPGSSQSSDKRKSDVSKAETEPHQQQSDERSSSLSEIKVRVSDAKDNDVIEKSPRSSKDYVTHPRTGEKETIAEAPNPPALKKDVSDVTCSTAAKTAAALPPPSDILPSPSLPPSDAEEINQSQNESAQNEPAEEPTKADHVTLEVDPKRSCPSVSPQKSAPGSLVDSVMQIAHSQVADRWANRLSQRKKWPPIIHRERPASSRRLGFGSIVSAAHTLSDDHISGLHLADRCLNNPSEQLKDILMQRFSEMGDILVFTNPNSGTGLSEELVTDVLQPMLDRVKHVDHKVIRTTHQGHCGEFVREADLSKVGTIAVVGGDGSFVELLNGIAARADAQEVFKRVRLSIVPFGTCNALACSAWLGDPLQACAAVFQTFYTPMDAMKITTPDSDVPEYSVCAVYYGFLSELLEKAEAKRGKKGRFVRAFLRTIVKKNKYVFYFIPKHFSY